MKKLTLMCAAVAAAMSMNAQEVTPLTADMWHQWDGLGADAKPLEDSEVTFVDEIGKEVFQDLIFGNASCDADLYANLTDYAGLEIEGTPKLVVRFYFNRQDNNPEKPMQGTGIEKYVDLNDEGKATLMFADVNGLKEYVHLNFVKLNWGNTGVIESINLLPKDEEVPDVPVDPLAINGDWFHEWNAFGEDATIKNEYPAGIEDNIGKELNGGATLLGNGGVPGSIFANLTEYAGIVAEGTPGSQLRLLFNRPSLEGGSAPITECNPVFDEDGKFTFMFTEVAAKEGEEAYPYVHLNTVKIGYGGVTPCIVTKFNVIEKEETPDDPTAVSAIESVESSVLYNVYGQRVDESYRGIVIKNGKKYINK